MNLNIFSFIVGGPTTLLVCRGGGSSCCPFPLNPRFASLILQISYLIILKTLTLFQTKIYYFPDPFSDLLNWPLIALCNPMTRHFFLFSFSICLEDECPCSVSKQQEMNMCGVILPCQNHTLFQTKKAKSIALFQSETALKPFPLGWHIPM